MAKFTDKISNLINTQIPEFVLQDHPKFVEFLKSYYTFMESAEISVTSVQSTDGLQLESEINTYTSTLLLDASRLDTDRTQLDSGDKVLDDAFKTPSGEMAFHSNFEKDDYMKAVGLVKNYIEEGDVMQVVLAQDFSQDFQNNPFDLYRALRQLNPSPYMYYLDLDECQIVGASPEILIRLEDDKVTLRPIAGTRKRGSNAEEDLANEKDLLTDPKEIAEHLMLIDLGRNDVGRVSKMGTVKVTDKMIVEKYSHVMHIVSNVTGTLSEDLDAIDALKAALPAGTLSGAPKIRAMKIINELEPSTSW